MKIKHAFSRKTYDKVNKKKLGFGNTELVEKIQTNVKYDFSTMTHAQMKKLDFDDTELEQLFVKPPFLT